MLKSFEREHMNKREITVPKKKEEGKLAFYFISSEGEKGFFIPGSQVTDEGRDRNGFRNRT